MRIAQLDLQAFGHFTARRLRFDAQPGLHITYGPNEAGKTTLSRALKAALFGIPERTGDNHTHANPNLRVGVVLQAANGEILAAMRRKARKNSLLRYDPETGEELGEAIADETLSRWLGGLSEGLYAALFGLNHDELVAGGKALSEGKGELGQSLFEAGAGLGAIRALRERLDKEADSLFRPRASSSALFKTLDQYHGARKEAKDAQTRPAEWTARREAVEAAAQAYAAARARQEQLQQETRRLERLAATLPDVALRGLTLDRLAELGEVVRLPKEAPQQRHAAEATLRQASASREQIEANIAALHAERAAIALPQTLLDEAGAIEALYHGLQTYRDARDQAAAASGRIHLAETQAQALLADFNAPGTDRPRELMPSATLRARVQTLATQGTQRQAELAEASRNAAKAERSLAELDQELAGLGPQTVPAALAEALKTFDAQGNPETQWETLARKTAKARAEIEAEAAALWEGGVEALVALVPPAPAAVQSIRESRNKLAERKQKLREAIEKNQNDLASAQGELHGLVWQGEVPDAGQLASLRGQRDALWQHIRRHAYPAPGQPAAEPPNPADYEHAVQAADQLADRRFADASRVTRHAEYLIRIEQMRQTIALDTQRLADATQDVEALRQQWRALRDKHRLPELSLAELDDWLARRGRFLEHHDAWADSHEQQLATAAQLAQARAHLSVGLTEAGLAACGEQETFALAMQRARDYQTQAAKAAENHKSLTKQKTKVVHSLAEERHKLAECRAALAHWEQDWAAAMAAIHLPAAASPEEASARLEQFTRLEKALDTRDAARAELAAAQTALARTEQETARLCQSLAYDPASRPADANIEALHERLREAQAQAQRAQSLADKLDQAAQAQAEAAHTIRQAEQQLAALQAQAGCATLEALAQAEALSAERESLDAKLAETEERLVKASGLKLAELLAQAEAQDLAQVQAAQQRTDTDLQACTTEVEALHAQLLAAQAALAQIDGSAQAAEAEQRAAASAAQLGQIVADYAQARLAAAVLAQVVETYQQRHQGPLLARASALFAQITCGRFAKVAADFDEDLAILVGVRPDGRREKVGNLSSGTRDQLFLALRLAAIESHLAAQETLPVVVDDIVINFDDDAAAATFQALAQLAEKTQVLFFTHHEHLLDTAAMAVGREGFVAHRL